jgi:hypothetical protein
MDQQCDERRRCSRDRRAGDDRNERAAPVSSDLVAVGGRGCLRLWHGFQCRVLAQHGLLEVSQRETGLEAKLVHERCAGLGVPPQRLGLATRSIEGEHVLGAEALAQRMLGGQHLELGNQRRVAPELEVGVDPQLERLETQLLESRDLAGGERVEREVRQRRTSPQGQRLAQDLRGVGVGALCMSAPPILEQLLEDAQIDLLWIDAQR